MAADGLRFGILFRRRVILAVSQNLCRVAAVQGNVEIDQADISLGSNHDIVRLDVAVPDGRLLSVQINQHAAQLLHPEYQPFLLKPVSLIEIALQTAPFDIVHHRVDL